MVSNQSKDWKNILKPFQTNFSRHFSCTEITEIDILQYLLSLYLHSSKFAFKYQDKLSTLCPSIWNTLIGPRSNLPRLDIFGCTCCAICSLLRQTIVLFVFKFLGKEADCHGLLLDGQKLLSHSIIQNGKVLDQTSAHATASIATTTTPSGT